MSEIWNSLTGALSDAIGFLEGALDGLFGVHAWGWAIIALTVIVRLFLLPLAIKQTRSMRAMQALQPRIKKIQSKYKTDRDLLKRDPQKYRERKQKMNEEVMALYKEHDVNPASGCLPLLPQIPIFFALFSVLRSPDFLGASEPFYFFTDHVAADAKFQGLGAAVSEAGWPGWLLIVAMAATMFITQRQMLSKTNAEGTQAQQQKIMMYVMPVFLAFIAQSLPLGVLLYWVTTNVWQGAQQYVILYEVEHHPEGPGSDVGSHPGGAKKKDESSAKRSVSGWFKALGSGDASPADEPASGSEPNTGPPRPKGKKVQKGQKDQKDQKGRKDQGSDGADAQWPSSSSSNGPTGTSPSGNGRSTSPRSRGASDHLPRRKGR